MFLQIKKPYPLLDRASVLYRYNTLLYGLFPILFIKKT